MLLEDITRRLHYEQDAILHTNLHALFCIVPSLVLRVAVFCLVLLILHIETSLQMLESKAGCVALFSNIISELGPKSALFFPRRGEIPPIFGPRGAIFCPPGSIFGPPEGHF